MDTPAAPAALDTPQPPPLLLDALFGGGAPPGLALHTDGQAPPTPTHADAARPHVTLTFAQSLDAKIGGARGKQLALSGRESLVMTHWMRTMHDAIMVGIGTALNDDPQLNTRHVPPLPEGHPHKYHLPRPVILDADLNLLPECKLLTNYAAGTGRRPWIIAVPPTRNCVDWGLRRHDLEVAGAKVIEVERENGRVSLPSMLKALRKLGVRSLMVEGGARVIQSFLAASTEKARLVDTVIVTVAPVFVGDEGVGYGANLSSSSVDKLQHAQTAVFGRDVVFALTPTQ
ncbi:RibD family protein [Phanerochaete sordida]|uniref:2,5-diamino-6-ribosylamino-4(3H)-pyrimidinone 5'-phosphate reductase n=1 Tax=Phanerochaete sordida TaxID=48140 RepID=A0A9P3G8R3_9APHY|nr:RibD family protein [Phanerochaete sordida]